LLERQQQEFGDVAPLSVAKPKPAAWTPPVKGAPEPKKNLTTKPATAAQ